MFTNGQRVETNRVVWHGMDFPAGTRGTVVGPEPGSNGWVVKTDGGNLISVFTAEIDPLVERSPGDGCLLLGNYRVQHVDCEDYPAGSVTDVRTGKFVK